MTSDDIAAARKLAERLQRLAAKHEGVSTLTREVTDAYAALAAEVERLTEILGIVFVIGGHDGACCPCVEVLERAWDAGGRPTSRHGLGGQPKRLDEPKLGDVRCSCLNDQQDPNCEIGQRFGHHPAGSYCSRELLEAE